MTIDEAIKQEKEKAVDCRQGAEVVKNMTYATWERENLPKQYIERAEYHEQLAEWLELLKWYQQGMEDIPSESGVLPKDVYRAGYIKAIDDFAEMMCVKSEELSCTTTINGMPVDILTLDGTTETIFEVAEQLKEGGNNG